MKVYQDLTIGSLKTITQGFQTKKSPGTCLVFELAHQVKALEEGKKKLIRNFMLNQFTAYEGSVYFIANRHMVLLLPFLSPDTVEVIQKDIVYFFSDLQLSTKAGKEISIHSYDLLTDIDKYTSKIDSLLNRQEKKIKINLEKVFQEIQNPEIFSSLCAARKNRSTKTILIIEDQVFSQKILKKSIEGNYKILTSENAVGGLKSYLASAPDLVFLDWQLPDADGMAFLDVIKKIDTDAYVIMSTANNTSENVKTALNKGVKGYITKPYTRTKVAKNLAVFEQKKAS